MRTEDGYIVHKCLKGDAAAFGLLVDKYKASIYAMAYSRLQNFHDAEDITQETFLKAYQKLRTLKWRDSILAWLYAIASNLCKQWIRSQSKRPDREFAADHSRDAANQRSMDSYRDDETYESLHDALDSISERYRQVLTLYYLGGLNSKEIARFLGTSPNNVAQRLRRARVKLKAEMIAAMSEVSQQKKLRSDFTFRILEVVKRMKIQSLPRTPWLPWGMSAVAGTVLTVLCFASLTSLFAPIHLNPAYPGGLRVKLPPYLDGGILASTDNVSVALMADENDPQFQTTEPSGGFLTHQGQGRGTQTDQTSSSVVMQRETPNIQEAVTISGKVVKSNVPVPNAQVHIYARDELRWETTAQVDGSFQTEIPKPDDEDWEHMLLTARASHPDESFGWTRLSSRNAAIIVVKLHDPIAVTKAILDEPGSIVQQDRDRSRRSVFPELGDPFGMSLIPDSVSYHSEVSPDKKPAYGRPPDRMEIRLDIMKPMDTGQGRSGDKRKLRSSWWNQKHPSQDACFLAA
jgi:RNA polymerase sigma factor (sigma-70 family)